MIYGEELDRVQFTRLTLAYLESWAALRRRARLRAPVEAHATATLRCSLVATEGKIAALARRLVPAREGLTDEDAIREAGPKAFEATGRLILAGR